MLRFQTSVLLLFLATQLVAPMTLRRRPRNHGRIIGGSDADIADYPWQLVLLYSGYQSCGASIIGTEWALTAAHCFTFTDALYFNLRAGSSKQSSGGTMLDVAEIHVHEQHNSVSGDYDIAVMRVAGSFPLGDNVAIVSLPQDGYDPPAGLAVTMTGWGSTETDYLPDTLQKMDISVNDRSVCEGITDIGRNVTARMLCAGETGRTVCYGDSGGPLVAADTQVGIASWGSEGCVSAAVFTNVGNLRSWINNITGV